MKIKWNIVGLVLSLACAIHCMLMPIILITFPIILSTWKAHHQHWIEWVIVFSSLVIGYATLRHSYKKHHQNPLSLVTFFIATVCILTSVFFLDTNSILFNMGNIFLLLSYILNFWYQRKAKYQCNH